MPPVYEALSSFKYVSNSEKQSLFVIKLDLCCVVFDYTNPTKKPKGERHELANSIRAC